MKAEPNPPEADIDAAYNSLNDATLILSEELKIGGGI
jgi:hypothetical protein